MYEKNIDLFIFCVGLGQDRIEEYLFCISFALNLAYTCFFFCFFHIDKDQLGMYF